MRLVNYDLSRRREPAGLLSFRRLLHDPAVQSATGWDRRRGILDQHHRREGMLLHLLLIADLLEPDAPYAGALVRGLANRFDAHHRSAGLERDELAGFEVRGRWGDWGLGLKVAAPFGMLERGPC